jgi:glutamyl-tRNA reductase
MPGIKYDPNESYDKWVEKVRIYEYGLALQRIAQGEPMVEIVEEMSRRISEKILHPWLVAIKETVSERWTDEDNRESARRYKEQYLDRYGPVADHVIDEDHVDNKND